MRFALLKAPIAGFFATLLLAALFFQLEGKGTFLGLEEISLTWITFAWSWTLYALTTGLFFGIFWMTDAL